jgi:hypothetical protein
MTLTLTRRTGPLQQDVAASEDVQLHREQWSYIPFSEARQLLQALNTRGAREKQLGLALRYAQQDHRNVWSKS